MWLYARRVSLCADEKSSVCRGFKIQRESEMNQQKRRHSVTILVPSSLAQQKCSLVNLLLIKNLILNTGLFVCKCPLTQQKNSFLHMQMRTKRMHRIHTRFSPSICNKGGLSFHFFCHVGNVFQGGGGRLFNFLQVYL